MPFDVNLKAVTPGQGPLICFSHLRWDFVFQRPQHLMTRFARTRRVYYWEEAVAPEPGEAIGLRTRTDVSGVTVVTPVLPAGLAEAANGQLRLWLRDLLADAKAPPTFWYYTPMMLAFSASEPAAEIVYDCMDELANFRFAPPELKTFEADLLARADVVFTGGYSLYEAKKASHRNIHPFPSSVDRQHFGRARSLPDDRPEQAALARPRLGFYGVVDERMDLGLLAAVADARPHWSIVIVGPVVKIDPADLPVRPNIHYVGGRSYDALPGYLAGWDVALMPFAINASTQFISPTKTPEYLAGGRPVVSTPIADVIRHYGDLDAVIVADGPEAFIAACDRAIGLAADPQIWLPRVDAVLAELSWDETHRRMSALMASSPITASPMTASSRGACVDRPTEAPRRSAPAKPYDYLIVGAGFAGSVLAERLARGLNKQVLLIDRRPHIGGNAYDHHDDAGVLIHKYGPHIFHTNAREIANYLGQFTAWLPYEHRVLAQVDGKLLPVPINRTTLNELYGLDLQTDEDAEAFLATRAEPVEKIETSEDVVVSAVGRDLYEKFFQGYTRKQWGLDPSQLDKSVTARVPTRTNTDDRYFTDTFQAMPAAGYTAMFEAMLDHPNIEVRLGVDFEDIRAETVFDHLIYTGPIDEYFGFEFGKLPYRCLSFRHETLQQPWLQDVAVVNYPDAATPYTRITEYKHLTGQDHPVTSITYEYPSDVGDPYYPVPRAENQALYKRYEALARETPGVTFVGRLATYRYYNMDQVVGQALATYRRIAEREAKVDDTLTAALGVGA